MTASLPNDRQQRPTALSKFSLRGSAQKLEDMAIEQRPLLGLFSNFGQSTVICAPPNAGKTLITLAVLIEAIDSGKLAGEDVIYVNSDDTTLGLAEKVRLLDDFDVHVVADGHNGFRSSMLASILTDMISDGSAHGKVLILDTLKKFTQVMNKTDTTNFTELMRKWVSKGGSIICLAHTNKKPNASGNNVYAGVADIIDDIDTAYILNVKPEHDGKKIVEFTNIKRRGNNPDTILYSYIADPDLSYTERLTSVREIEKYDSAEEQADATDDDVLDALGLAIKHRGQDGKMSLVRSAAMGAQCSKSRVLRLFEEHTGDDPAKHRWNFVTGAHGKRTYRLNGVQSETG